MQYQPPAHGWRTFVIIWLTQSLSVIGSALTFFAINIWVVQVLYPRPEQKPELALALSAMALSFAVPTMFAAPQVSIQAMGFRSEAYTSHPSRAASKGI